MVLSAIASTLKCIITVRETGSGGLLSLCCHVGMTIFCSVLYSFPIEGYKIMLEGARGSDHLRFKYEYES